MEFQLLLTNQQKTKWLLLYLVAVGCSLALLGIAADKLGFDRLNPFVAAGLMIVALALLIGAVWFFERLQANMREPVCITVLPNRLLELHEQTGILKTWEFQQLLSYHYQDSARGVTFLLLTFRNGRRVKWLTGDAGFRFKNAEAFALMVEAFENAWRDYQANLLIL